MNAIGRSTVRRSPISRKCWATASLESQEPTPVTCWPTPAAPYTTWLTPASAAASATLRPWCTSAVRLLVIGFCTLKTPCTPSNARSNELTSSVSTRCSSAPVTDGTSCGAGRISGERTHPPFVPEQVPDHGRALPTPPPRRRILGQRGRSWLSMTESPPSPPEIAARRDRQRKPCRHRFGGELGVPWTAVGHQLRRSRLSWI